jgi:hypothetical protein
MFTQRCLKPAHIPKLERVLDREQEADEKNIPHPLPAQSVFQWLLPA